MKTKHFILAMLLIAGYSSHAQVPGLPNSSPTQTISQNFGLGNVSVSYSRPKVKDRIIFGGLVPFGEVWRVGANSATTISFSDNVVVEGNNVPAGEYALFCIPEKDQWTIILNKNTKQWGAYTYNKDNDFLRFKVKTARTAEKKESFVIQFDNSTNSTTDLYLAWDHTSASIKMKTDDDAKIMANIAQLLEAKEVSNLIYFNSVQYYYEHNKDITQSLSLVARAEKDFPQRPAFRLFESRMLLRKGDKAAARAAAETGIKIAKETKSDEYVRLNQIALGLAK